MARPTVKERTRTSLPQGNPQAPQLDVVAPLDVHAAGGEGMAAVSKALGMGVEVAAPIYKQAQEKDAARGAFDVANNTVDSKKMANSRAYNDAYTMAKAKAEFITKKQTLLEWYDKEYDKANGDPNDLDKHILDFYKDNYGHIDDARIAKAISGDMEEFRQALVNRQLEITRKAVADDHVSNVSKEVEDAVNSGKTVDVNAQKDKLAAVLGRPAAAREYAKMVVALGIKKKDPDLIRALVPAEWQDGTPGPWSIPEVAAELNQGVYFAGLQRDSVESHERAEAKRLRDVQADQLQNEMLTSILAGNDVTQAVAQNAGILNFTERTQILNANETIKNRREKGDAGDPRAISELTYGLFTGEKGMSDIWVALGAPDAPLGTGQAMQANAQRLIDSAKAAKEHIERMRTDTAYGFYAKQLEELTPIVKDPTGVVAPDTVAARQMATARYHELVSSGKMNAPDAFAQVRKEIPQLNEAGTISFNAGTPPNAAEVLQSLRIKRFTPEMRQKYQPKVINELFDSGDLTYDQAQSLRGLYKQH